MFLIRIQWAAARVVFLSAFAFCFCTGIGIYAIAPLATYYYFGTLRFWRHLAYFPGMMKFAYRHVFMILLNKNYRSVFSIPMTAAPLNAPDMSRVRLSAAWPHDAVGCNGCTRCCDKIDCPLIDGREGKCLAYGTFYWRYFNCGRYPEKQAQIDYYGCRKWLVVEAADPAMPPRVPNGYVNIN